MPSDPVQDAVRLAVVVIQVHGIEEFIKYLPEDVYFKLYAHFANVVQEDKK